VVTIPVSKNSSPTSNNNTAAFNSIIIMSDSSSLGDRVLAEVKEQYPNAIECSIVDHSDGCGAKLELTVVSESFEGMMLLKRHREIQNHLKEKGLFDEIHALQIKAWTPSQWEKKKGEN